MARTFSSVEDEKAPCDLQGNLDTLALFDNAKLVHATCPQRRGKGVCKHTR